MPLFDDVENTGRNSILMLEGDGHEFSSRPCDASGTLVGEKHLPSSREPESQYFHLKGLSRVFLFFSDCWCGHVQQQLHGSLLWCHTSWRLEGEDIREENCLKPSVTLLASPGV